MDNPTTGKVLATLLFNENGKTRFEHTIVLPADSVQWPSSFLANGVLYIYGGRYMHFLPHESGLTVACFYFNSTPAFLTPKRLEADARWLDDITPAIQVPA